ncbi:MAG: hypothetical protein ACOZNI_17525 [Myxococcota bacterium]
MMITTNLEIAAWSGDGGTALVRRVEQGPEGGGRLVWLVVNAAGTRAWVLSSDLSPGDGSTPQTVSEKACRSAAKELATRLASFDGVKVRAEKCAGDRGAVLEIAPATAERAANSFSPVGTEVKRLGKTLRVIREGLEVEIVKVDHRAKDIAWASAGPLVLVIERGEHADALLAAVVQTPKGLVTVPVE